MTAGGAWRERTGAGGPLPHQRIGGTREELDAKLREQGISDLAQVRAAYLEGDGHVSVIRQPDKGSQR